MVFREGMKVRLKHVEEVNHLEYPAYVSSMEREGGKIITLPPLRTHLKGKTFTYKGYCWNIKWVTPVIMENV